MLFVLLAMVAAVLTSSLAWSYPRAAARLFGGGELARELARLTPQERVRRLRDAGGWLAELALELADAPSEAARLAAVNEAVASLEHELSRRESLPVRSAWLTSLSALLIALGGYFAGVRQQLLYLLPIAVAGIAACLAARHRGRWQVDRQRRRIDALLAALVDGFDPAVELPVRRPRRFRNKRAQKGSL